MDFDKIGVQHVSKRRNPSPVRNAKRPTSSGNTVFNQKISPRTGRFGASSSSEKSLGHFFSKNSEKKPGKAENRDNFNQEVYKRKPVSGHSKLSIPASSIKTAVIICGILVICVVGPNWDGISSWYASQNISVGPSNPNTGKQPPMEAGYKLPSPGDQAGTSFDISAQIPRQDKPETYEPPLNLTKTFKTIEHTVKRGENMSVIAAKYSVNMESIIAINGLKDATVLPEGKKLKIPNMNGILYTVKKNDTLIKIAANEKTPVNAILDANDLRSDEIYTGQVLFLPGARMNSTEYLAAIKRNVPEKPLINPLPGRMHITSHYGNRLCPVNPKSGVIRFHEGIDLRGSIGTTVKAAMSGVVEETGHSRVMGNFVILKHNNYRSLYAHLSAISVKNGEQINQGKEIGKVGKSGYTDGGSHLHFAVYDRNGNSVNPVGLLK